MRIAILAALTAFSTSISVPALAQSEAAATEAFGKCLVERDRGKALGLFERLPADATSVDLNSGTVAGCTVGSASAQAMVVRGAIAEALYERDFREIGFSPRRAVADLARLNLPDGDADTTGIFRIGHCVARSAGNDVQKLFATEPGSEREAKVMARLMPYLAPCQPKGMTVSLKRNHLRALFAQSAYVVNASYWQGSMRAAKTG